MAITTCPGRTVLGRPRLPTTWRDQIRRVAVLRTAANAIGAAVASSGPASFQRPVSAAIRRRRQDRMVDVVVLDLDAVLTAPGGPDAASDRVSYYD